MSELLLRGSVINVKPAILSEGHDQLVGLIEEVSHPLSYRFRQRQMLQLLGAVFDLLKDGQGVLSTQLKSLRDSQNSILSLEEAREWVEQFIRWYNWEHRHSGIHFVCPIDRHTGADIDILTRRQATYEQAKARHPLRWGARKVRNWTPPQRVVVRARPDKDSRKPCRNKKRLSQPFFATTILKITGGL